MRTHHLRVAVALCALPLASAFGQGTLADYRRADSIATRLNALFVGMPTAPEWIGRTTRFWYRTTVTGGSHFTHVDAATAVKSPLFDHARLAAALSTVLGTTVTALTLPFTTPATMLRIGNSIEVGGV